MTAACSGARPAPAVAPAALPRTRAEHTSYRETSRHADVLAFLDSLRTLGAPIRVDTMGRSPAGRPIPYVIASRPMVRTPAEARRLRRPIVYVQANIHAGEVEGKEALLALLRDLTFSRAPNALDSIVLIAVPIYNIDGNERVGAQADNRNEQNGPERVGERANGQGLDLNRDYIKLEAPETRAALALFAAWDPHLFVDLHTTDGSFHGYALTYAASLAPAATFLAAGYTRDSLLPTLRQRMRERRRFEVFDYGNFSFGYGAEGLTDTLKQGWYSYDHRPRFGSNYYGLRGRLSVLSEAYSHDPFERRVASTYAFVAELLSLVAERGPRIVELTRDASATVTRLGGQAAPETSITVPLRAALTQTPDTLPVIVEELVPRADTTAPGEPGVPASVRRTGRYRTQRMPVYATFTPTLEQPLPYAWALGPGADEIVRLLRLHGIRVDRLAEDAKVHAELYRVDSALTASRPFQGHHEVTLRGRWRNEERTLAAGSYVVPAGQPLGILAMVLLDPESDDGLVSWNAFDAELHPGADFPVVRIPRVLLARMRQEQERPPR